MTTSHTSVTVERFSPQWNNRSDTHLEFQVWFTAANGSTRWVTGTLNWAAYPTADQLLADVLKHQTDFVQQQWFRIEVCLPNRDHYGNLKSGFIQDTGLLLALRKPT